LTYQEWIGSLPIFVVDAVYVTESPWQTVSAEFEIETLKGSIGFTSMMMAAEVSELDMTQESLEIRIQYMVS
jgi:hypothetical protein